MAKIDRIIDPSFRSGTSSKTGKPWVMMKVEVDGKEASIFAPAAVGDEVSLTYNEQYKNYNAEKLTPQKQEKAQLETTLNSILSSLGRIERHLKVNPVGSPGSTSDVQAQNQPPSATNGGLNPAPPTTPDLPPVESYEEDYDSKNPF